MNFAWKRPLVITLAALGLISTANQLDTLWVKADTTPAAKTQDLQTAANKRNVTFTGTSALYTKPATTSGSRLVVSKTDLKALAKSDQSTNNFIAYKVTTTRNNQVYYKITSFDGQYRGWIYGGKTVGQFSGGLRPFTTFKTVTLPTALSKYSFRIAAPGLNNNGQSLTYKQPQNTVYGAGRVIGNSINYREAAFKIDAMGTRTREGDTWVHISSTDSTNAKANGWILYKALAEAESPISQDTLRIDLVNSKGQLIKDIDYQKDGAQFNQPLGISYSTEGTPVWLLKASDLQKIQDQVRTALQGTGYELEAISANQGGFLAQATFGNRASLTVTQSDPIAANAIRVNITNGDDAVVGSFDYVKSDTSQTDNGALSDTDKTTLQSNINTALKSTGYTLKSLSDDQLNQLANAQPGSNVYLKATTKTDTIADNALRINLIDPATKKVVKSIDYTNTDADDPAPKGSTLGHQQGNQMTLAADDNTAITNEIVATLDGTGFELANNQLSDANTTTLAAGQFGGSVNIDVIKSAK